MAKDVPDGNKPARKSTRLQDIAKATDASLKMSSSYRGSLSQEIGTNYQLHVALLMIAYFAENEILEECIIYHNHKFIGYFDDVVILAKYKKSWHLHGIQIKFRSVKLNFNDTETTHDISNYINAYETMKAYAKLKDVKRRNIHLYLFCNNYLIDYVNVYEGEQWFKRCKQECETVDTIVPSTTDIYCKYVDTNNTNTIFFNKFLLLEKQGTLSDIKTKIKEKLKINDDILSKITNYVYWYFMNNKNGLTISDFKIELLSMLLEDWRVKPKNTCIDMNKKLYKRWLKVIENFQVILMEDHKNVERKLYGGIAAELFDNISEWNDSIFKNSGNLTKDIIERARKFIGLKETTSEVSTLNNLELTLWKYKNYHLPLKTDSETRNIFEHFQDLQKRCILIGSLKRLKVEYENSQLDVFSDFKKIDVALRKKFLKGISISLQSRRPISLDNFADDDDVMEELTGAVLLDLMTNRKLYIKKKCIDDLQLFYEIEKYKDTDETGIVTDHIKVYVKKSQVLKYHMQEIDDEKLLLLHGDKAKLNQYFVDQYNHKVYYVDGMAPIPLIGQIIYTPDINTHIVKSFHRGILQKDYVMEQKKRVFLVTKDPELLKKITRRKVYHPSEIKKIEKNYLLQEKTAYIDATCEIAENIWLKLLSYNTEILWIEVNNKAIHLLKYKNCKNISAAISYSKESFRNERFFSKTSNGIIILTTESKIRSASFLRTLAMVEPSSNYILICNLMEYQFEIEPAFKRLLEKPLEFIFDKYQSCPKMYDSFLRKLFKYYQKEGNLILYMFNFEECFSKYTTQILTLIKKIAESKLRIVIVCSENISKQLIDILGFYKLEGQIFKLIA